MATSDFEKASLISVIRSAAGGGDRCSGEADKSAGIAENCSCNRLHRSFNVGDEKQVSILLTCRPGGPGYSCFFFVCFVNEHNGEELLVRRER